jgi:hypothetical protein
MTLIGTSPRECGWMLVTTTYRCGVLGPTPPPSDVRVFVGDTAVLLDDVLHGLRHDVVTGLLAALWHSSARLFLPRHVLVEVERGLPERCAGGDDPEAALTRWRGLYLPYVRVVDVPDRWGELDSRVHAVAARYPVDTPTASLAMALAPCHVLASDRDLKEAGLGHRGWLQLALGSANGTRMELIATKTRVPTILTVDLTRAAAQLAARLPDLAQAMLLAGGGAALYWWHQDGQLQRQLGRLKQVGLAVAGQIEPLVDQIAERHQPPVAAWAAPVVEPATPPDLDSQVARILARAPEPGMLASEIARGVEGDGTLAQRTTAVRAALHESSAFVEVARGRWLLGRAATDRPESIQSGLKTDWLQQAHATLMDDLGVRRARPPMSQADRADET